MAALQERCRQMLEDPSAFGVTDAESFQIALSAFASSVASQHPRCWLSDISMKWCAIEDYGYSSFTLRHQSDNIADSVCFSLVTDEEKYKAVLGEFFLHPIGGPFGRLIAEL